MLYKRRTGDYFQPIIIRQRPVWCGKPSYYFNTIRSTSELRSKPGKLILWDLGSNSNFVTILIESVRKCFKTHYF